MFVVAVIVGFFFSHYVLAGTGFISLSDEFGFGAVLTADIMHNNASSFCTEVMTNNTLRWQSPLLLIPTAHAISLRWAYVYLPPGASLVLTNPLTHDVQTLASYFLVDRVYTNQVIRIPWSAVQIQLYVPSETVFCPKYGLRIDAYAKSTAGDLSEEGRADLNGRKEEICGIDGSVDAVCTYDPANALDSMYTYSRAVLRIVINPGQAARDCTGWLWGCEGHVITNNHCIGSAADAANAQFQFLAEKPTCSINKNTKRQYCRESGKTEAISAAFIYTNFSLDVTLVQLNATIVKKYGYLQTRSTPPQVGDAIYMPQHPRGGCKSISYTNDGQGPTRITSVATSGCDKKGGVQYDADTAGGSSGSPVLLQSDNTVVALHYCGGYTCDNAGIPFFKIVQDFERRQLVPKCGLLATKTNRSILPAYTDPREQVTPQRDPVVYSAWTRFDGHIKPIQVEESQFYSSVDHYRFRLDKPGKVRIDIMSVEADSNGKFWDLNGDCDISYIDPAIRIFSAENNASYAPISNDDNENFADGDGTSDGSVSNTDPYVDVALPPGEHVVAVGLSGMSLTDAKKGISNNYPVLFNCIGSQSDHGAYRISVASTTPLTWMKTPPTIPIESVCPFSNEEIDRACQAALEQSIYD